MICYATIIPLLMFFKIWLQSDKLKRNQIKIFDIFLNIPRSKVVKDEKTIIIYVMHNKYHFHKFIRESAQGLKYTPELKPQISLFKS